MAIDLHSVILCFLCFTSVVSLSGFYAGDESCDELTTSTAILILRLLCNTLVQEVSLDIFLCLRKNESKSNINDSRREQLRKTSGTRGPFLESPDNIRARKDVVVYKHNRGFNIFASNMIKLSVHETKWNSLLAGTHAPILYILI